MSTNRLEAFSDGVIAILITIMVLELKVPHEPGLAGLRPLLPLLLSYALSFVILGIYWNNHHHLLKASRHVDGRVMWANLHLLFWLSLIPFGTSWAGETDFAAVPVAAYGVILLMAGFAYSLLVRALISTHGRQSALAAAVQRDFKGNLSVALYALAVPVAFWQPLASCAIYVIVAVIWLVPDRRMERVIPHGDPEG